MISKKETKFDSLLYLGLGAFFALRLAKIYNADMLSIIAVGIILIGACCSALSQRKDSENIDELDDSESITEKKIDHGIYLCCAVFFVVIVGILVKELNIKIFDIGGDNFYVLFLCAFALSFILKRIRPPMTNAGKGWMMFYKFILSQLDLDNAFHRKKK